MKIIIDLQESEYTNEQKFINSLANLCIECGYEVIQYDEEIYDLPQSMAAELERITENGLI